SSTQADRAKSSRVSVPLPEDPHEAIMQAYLEGTDIEFEHFEDPESETDESSHIVALPTCYVEESEGSGTSDARSMSSDSTVPLSPDHPLTHTTPILVPILCRTARMTVHVPPVMSHGLSVGIAEVAAMPDSTFRKRFRSFYDSSPSPTLPVWKRYKGTSELILGADSEEIDESSDSDSKNDESYGLDDESHGVDDESRGLEDDSHGLESDGLGLEEEEVVPEGQQKGAQSSRVSVPLPEDPYEAIMQAYLEWTNTESEPFEDPESETHESSHIVAPPTCHVKESEGSGTFGARSMSLDSTAPLSPDHPLTHTTPILVPILCRTARMAVHVPPVMSHGLSAGIAEVVAMPDSAFRKRFRSSYDSSPSPTLPVRKTYRGTSELILGADSEEIDESLDFDSESEDAEDEGPTAEDEDPATRDEGLAMGVEGPREEEAVPEGQQQGAQSSRVSVPLPEDPYEAIMHAYLEWTDTESEPFGNPLPEDLYESYGLDDESYGLDDESHGVDGESRGLDDDGRGLGYGSLRHQELALEEDHVYSTFEVGQDSGSAPEPERSERVSSFRQPTLTTWIDPEDDMVYIDVPVYPPPTPTVQTPPSPDWTPDRFAPKPILSFPFQTTTRDAKTSGAPLPRANKVTSPILGVKLRCLDKDPYDAIMQAYLEGTDTEFEPFEDPESETDESSHIVAPPTCYVEESEGSGTSDARSMSSDSTVPLSLDHPLTHTTPVLVPILRRTARMAMHVPPVMSHGLSAGIAEVAAMPNSAFRKRFKSSYDSLPSSTLPVWKRYKGTSDIILGDDSEEIDESSDSDSESEDAKDEGPTAEDEDPAAGDEGLAMGVEGPDVDDESYGLDDESHGVDDESRGLEDDSRSLESDGLGLEEEEVVPEGQQQGAQSSRVSVPLPEDPYEAIMQVYLEWTDTESEPFGNPLPEDLYESYGLDDESYGLDDESHGVDDESRGLDDDGHGLESDGLGLGEEVVPEGQQQGAQIMRTTLSMPLGLGYGSLRHQELVLEDDHVYSTFEVGRDSGSAPEAERLERVSSFRQPTLTTWTDPEDDMVYIDVPVYPPPTPPSKS
nr:hypothetical protein [Tanacetum cinerariifolium]